MNRRIAIRILAAATVVLFTACEKKAGQPNVLPSSQDTTPAQTTAPSTVQITKKLNGIIFPKIDFRDSTVREAIEFLVDKSKKLDEPSHEGVNIVLKLGDGGSGAPAPGPIPGMPAIPGGGDKSSVRITLNLNNVPMLEVIKYITNLANLKYKVEPSGVQIVPLD